MKESNQQTNPLSAAMDEHLRSGETASKVQEIVFAKHGHMWVVSLKGKGLIDKLYPDGKRITGRVVDGKFVEVE